MDLPVLTTCPSVSACAGAGAGEEGSIGALPRSPASSPAAKLTNSSAVARSNSTKSKPKTKPTTSTAARSDSVKSCHSLRRVIGKVRLTNPDRPTSPSYHVDILTASDEMNPETSTNGNEGAPPDHERAYLQESENKMFKDQQLTNLAGFVSPPTSVGDKRSSRGSHYSLTHDVGGGDIVLILGLPDIFTIGYDSVTLTAKSFQGIKGFPVGAHFIWVAQPDGVSTRCGCWIHTSPREKVHVLQWDVNTELLVESTHTEARYQVQDIAKTYPNLFHYRDPGADRVKGSMNAALIPSVADDLKAWPLLTNAITEDLVIRLIGFVEQGVYFCHTTDMVKGYRTTAQESLMKKRLSTSLLQTKELNFTFLQEDRTYGTNVLGRQRTLEAIDSTSYLHGLLTSQGRDAPTDDFRGELQFAFIVGMHLGNDLCIQQWFYMLVKLVLRAFSLPEQHTQLATSLLHTMGAQLTYGLCRLETPFIDYLGDFQKRELRLSLIVYKRRLDELLVLAGDSASPDLLAAGNAFTKIESIVTEHLDWDLKASYLRSGKVVTDDGEELELDLEDLEGEDERGEYAPNIVSLDESGRQSDLISWST